MLSGTSASRSRTGIASTRSREPLGEIEVALDHRAVARAAVRAKRRPHRDRARSPRRLGARELVAGEICGREPERRVQRCRVAQEGEPAVVGHVEPLVSVRDDRIGALDAGRELGRARGQPGEEAEGAVDVEPGAVALGEVGHPLDRVEVAGVHLACVPDQDRGSAVERRQLALQRVHVQPSRRVGRENANRPATEAEHGERLRRARMHVAAREDRHGRQPREAALVDVDAVPLGPPATRSRERREVRRRGAGRQDAAPARRAARRGRAATRSRRPPGERRAAS